MRIVLGSKNKAKKEAIELALKELNISDYEILMLDVNSLVSSKPIDGETLTGAKNRNNEVLQYCIQNNIDYDLLISIEGGYEQVDNYYFIVTYAAIIDKEGNEFVGKSQGLQITQKMFEWVKNGQSLNKVIESLLATQDNKKSKGISGYLTNDYYKRSYFDSSAVISVLEHLKNYEYYEMVEREMNKMNIEEKDENLKKYYSIIERYHNGDFGDDYLTLKEILRAANEEDLLDKMSIEEIDYLINHSSGMMKWMFSNLKQKKVLNTSGIKRNLTK